MKRLSKTEARKQIDDFFLKIKSKNSKDIKKIKKLATGQNIPLKELKKKFCKKCLTPYKKPKIRFKNNMKSITCENCGSISRWRTKLS